MIRAARGENEVLCVEILMIVFTDECIASDAISLCFAIPLTFLFIALTPGAIITAHNAAHLLLAFFKQHRIVWHRRVELELIERISRRQKRLYLLVCSCWPLHNLVWTMRTLILIIQCTRCHMIIPGATVVD